VKCKSQVALTGYYGQRNFGDDIFCVVASWGIKKFWNKEIVFLTNEMPVLPKEIQFSFIPPKHIKGFSLLHNVITSMMSDYIIYAGGSIFHTKPKSILYLNYWHYGLAQFSHKFGAIGISTGPFKSMADYEWVKKFLGKFEFISVRDYQSFNTLESMKLPGKIVQAFDMAVLSPIIDQEVVTERKIKRNIVLGISICHYERFINGDLLKEAKRENNLFQTIELILRDHKDVEIRIFSLNNHPINGDKLLAIELKQHLSNFQDRIEIICHENDPLATWRQIKECDMMIGIRLHSCILAYAAKIPFIMVEYHQKCSDFLDYINFPKQYRLFDECIEPTDLSHNVHEILDMGSEKFYEAILPLAQAQNLALKSFTEAPWVKVVDDKI
jgi:polysaccharide pyruvyl transferase WcaK-like protein